MFHWGDVTLSWPVSKLLAVEAVGCFPASRCVGRKCSGNTLSLPWPQRAISPKPHFFPGRAASSDRVQRSDSFAPLKDGSEGHSSSRGARRTGFCCGCTAVQHFPLPGLCLRAPVYRLLACTSLAQKLSPWKLNVWYPLIPKKPLSLWRSRCPYSHVTLGKQPIEGPSASLTPTQWSSKECLRSEE